MNETVIVNNLVIPPEEAEKLVLQANKVYLRNCPCRSDMQICPQEQWKVCMLFEHASEGDRRQTTLISPEEAVQIVNVTTARGNIHQVFYFQDGELPFELCNCCTCCCYPLREAKEKGDKFKGLLHSGYIAVTDAELCVGCGECVDHCFFKARQLKDIGLHFVDSLCFGCGRCVPNCPEEAIQIEFYPERGIPIPSLST